MTRTRTRAKAKKQCVVLKRSAEALLILGVMIALSVDWASLIF